MSGIQVFIMRRDFTIAKKKIRSNSSHIHYAKGSYLNRGDAILKAANENDPPVLIFQEGNAIPMSASAIKISEDANNPQPSRHPLEAVKWETWYLPMLRGLNRQHHGRGNLIASFGKIFNLKTFPFWLIGLFLLWHFLSPMFLPAAPPSPSPPPLP